jgi:hypothetical protein
MFSRKSIRLISYILISIIFVFIITINVLNKCFNKSIIKNIKSHVYESTNHEYILNLETLTVDIFSHSINVTNFIIEPFQKEKAINKYFVFKVKSLKINDFSIVNYILDHEINIYSVDFIEPELIIYLDSDQTKKLDH